MDDAAVQAYSTRQMNQVLVTWANTLELPTSSSRSCSWLLRCHCVRCRSRANEALGLLGVRCGDDRSVPLEGGWTWGGKSVFGMYDLSYSDYAGSGIVHLAGAAAALAGVILLGPRNGKYGESGSVSAIPGANLPLATLGTFILWMGWFGFNGGSTLKLGGIGVANEVANVFLNTNAAASGGLIAAMITARLLFGKTDLTMCLNGALAGLLLLQQNPRILRPYCPQYRSDRRSHCGFQHCHAR